MLVDSLFKNCILILLISLSHCAYSQTDSIIFSYQLGVGTYQMGSLRDMNEDRLATIPAKAKILQNYPPFFIHTFKLGWTLGNSDYIGAVGEYSSTGSRISYKDYSGELKFDSKISAISIGTQYLIRLTEVNKFQLNVGSYLLANFTTLTFDSFLIANEIEESATDVLKSIGVSLVPCFSASKDYKSFVFATELGVNIQAYSQDLHIPGNPDVKLINDSNSFIKQDWSGLRLNLSVSYLLP